MSKHGLGVLGRLERTGSLIRQQADSKDILQSTLDLIAGIEATGSRLWIIGNGGSAALASHVAVDLTKNTSVRASAFNDVDLITCFANDYGHDKWMVEALSRYASSGDAVIAISSSGRSMNIVNSVRYCGERGIDVATFTGMDADNPVIAANPSGSNIHVRSYVYNEIESVHQAILLAIVDELAGL